MMSRTSPQTKDVRRGKKPEGVTLDRLMTQMPENDTQILKTLAGILTLKAFFTVCTGNLLQASCNLRNEMSDYL